ISEVFQEYLSRTSHVRRSRWRSRPSAPQLPLPKGERGEVRGDFPGRQAINLPYPPFRNEGIRLFSELLRGRLDRRGFPALADDHTPVILRTRSSCGSALELWT